MELLLRLVVLTGTDSVLIDRTIFLSKSAKVSTRFFTARSLVTRSVRQSTRHWSLRGERADLVLSYHMNRLNQFNYLVSSRLAAVNKWEKFIYGEFVFKFQIRYTRVPFSSGCMKFACSSLVRWSQVDRPKSCSSLKPTFISQKFSFICDSSWSLCRYFSWSKLSWDFFHVSCLINECCVAGPV